MSIILTSTNFEELKKFMLESNLKKIFSFINSYSIHLFNNNKKFKTSISNDYNINLIDGAPVALILSLKRFKKFKRTTGPDFTNFLLNDNDLMKDRKHFFIGLEEKDLEVLFNKYPLLKKENVIVYNPPYIETLEFQTEEINKICRMVNKFSTNYLWIGIGNLKQEILANILFNKVSIGYIFNVGAALDFITSKKKRAPKIFQKCGLEWAYRLCTDFRHSWKKVWRSFSSMFLMLKKIEVKRL